MKFRPLMKKDIPATLPLFEEFCKEMEYPFDGDSVQLFISNCLDKKCFLEIAEDENEHPIGVVGTMTLPYLSSIKALRVIEFLWHSAPKLPSVTRARFMVEGLGRMERYAEEQRLPFVVGVSERRKSESLGRVLVKRGYRPIETIYMKETRTWG
jgi:hypothetical protein